jgi:hypothetical protein
VEKDRPSGRVRSVCLLVLPLTIRLDLSFQPELQLTGQSRLPVRCPPCLPFTRSAPSPRPPQPPSSKFPRRTVCQMISCNSCASLSSTCAAIVSFARAVQLFLIKSVTKVSRAVLYLPRTKAELGFQQLPPADKERSLFTLMVLKPVIFAVHVVTHHAKGRYHCP